MIEKTALGRTGLQVTRLGYGAMEIRGPRVWSGRPVSDEESTRILNAVLDAGINFIDTSYDYGRSEELIGKFISHRRAEYYLATKCGCTLVDHGDHDETPHVWTRDNLLHNIDTSLRRLKTDYVDLMQLHGPTVQQAEDGELVDVLKEIQATGKVRWIGVSSYMPNLPGFIAQDAFDTYQIPYSGLEREHEPWIAAASERGAGVIVRGGVGQGEPGYGRGSQDRWSIWEQAKLDELLGEGETRTGFLLRFTLANPHMDTTIVGTKNPEHLSDNLRHAAKGKLPDDVYTEAKKRLDAIAPNAITPP
ncbi:aryl-alcohol dehydrogenase-like predicted oxidoreductase [Paenibacillus phyllosphaerae]|uniref:Aryl-alcohol dehydrogenase-like predicted oxidoreductase n=1 Tax=Paenibacillus phyllosphaerae TaxID=274593 RepID=A0A7W5FQ37_9BACL|nr:aldo/keto reductase [Paenibacillus phyllosphaerae]MBB3113035.1 aryl-alcohol dehydrogenase-like predicted oxidoreductase [Paenibacillus phyllosphaerae]